MIRAKQIDPTNLDYSYTLADHYIKTSQIAKAKHIAEDIKIKFPNSGVGEQILNYINNMSDNLIKEL